MIYIIGNDGTPVRVDGVGNELYPVGSIYMSVNSTSPASMFGGTWEQIKDCFLWATGDTTSITYTENGVSVTKSLTAGSTGGEATHTLTVDEMPSHNHQLRCSTTDYWSGAPHVLTKSASSGNADGEIMQGPDVWWSGVGITGGGQAHNNMPPYLAVYCWKRIG